MSVNSRFYVESDKKLNDCVSCCTPVRLCYESWQLLMRETRVRAAFTASQETICTFILQHEVTSAACIKGSLQHRCQRCPALTSLAITKSCERDIDITRRYHNQSLSHGDFERFLIVRGLCWISASLTREYM